MRAISLIPLLDMRLLLAASVIIGSSNHLGIFYRTVAWVHFCTAKTIEVLLIKFVCCRGNRLLTASLTKTLGGPVTCLTGRFVPLGPCPTNRDCLLLIAYQLICFTSVDLPHTTGIAHCWCYCTQQCCWQRREVKPHYFEVPATYRTNLYVSFGESVGRTAQHRTTVYSSSS